MVSVARRLCLADAECGPFLNQLGLAHPALDRFGAQKRPRFFPKVNYLKTHMPICETAEIRKFG